MLLYDTMNCEHIIYISIGQYVLGSDNNLFPSLIWESHVGVELEHFSYSSIEANYTKPDHSPVGVNFELGK